MVKKRARRVPAALHHELSEYASLLRALRVRDAMDLTKHLLRPNPFLLNNDMDPSCTPGAGPSNLAHPANAQTQFNSARAKGKQKAAPLPPKQVRRDHWTRWPLPLEDVLLPEWTLADEVSVIASQILKSRPPIAFPCPVASLGTDDLMDEDDEDERVVKVMDMDVDSDDPDPPYYVPYLTSIIAKFLSTIFGILASHTPRRPASMQNRIEPLGWRAVIDVVVSCDIPEFSNPKVVENVIKRMERVFGSSILPLEGKKATSFRAVERMKDKDAQSEAFEKLFEKERALFFAQPDLPPEAFKSPSPEPIPEKKTEKKRKNKKEREEEAGYRARKHWTPKDKQDKQDKPKPQPKSKAKAKAKTSKKKTSAAQAVDAEAQSAPGSDTEVPMAPEPSQPVRRSARAKKSNVNYRETLPDDIP
ncbi:hypothetical protein CVT25_012754 [Psilocybe cyanescens]|uniref:Uncharacterized protein n=1 Tax=Psilocybe cyanescens TaxID=93625 RepID=A0A409VYR3_PSICY|nr:hypothetical protein CVT25_012754 [Psilocybe cyanescens]